MKNSSSVFSLAVMLAAVVYAFVPSPLVFFLVVFGILLLAGVLYSLALSRLRIEIPTHDERQSALPFAREER